MRLRTWAVASTAVLVLPLVTAGALSAGAAPETVDARQTAKRSPVTLLAVGDIACDPSSSSFNSATSCQQDRVGRLVRERVRRGADYFVPLGDIQYETGNYGDFMRVYDPAFGQVRSVTKPIPGNHEYRTRNAAGYFQYFGKRAGTADRPWRSFIAKRGWRVLLLDSNCGPAGGCGPTSPQGRWIRRTLARAHQPCVIAAWHHPLRSSGEYHGSRDSISRARPLWNLVNAGGADIVLNGHDHIYERFAKRGGMQQFTVGTGGKNHYRVTTKAKGSLKRISNRYGVLRLGLLRDHRYRYSFLSVGGDVVDRGVARCTNRPHR